MTRHPRLETTKVEKGRERIPKNPGFVGDDETTCLAIVKSSTFVRGRRRKREKGNVNTAVDRRVSSTNCTTFYPTRRRSQCSCPFFFRNDPICSWARRCVIGPSIISTFYVRGKNGSVTFFLSFIATFVAFEGFIVVLAISKVVVMRVVF